MPTKWLVIRKQLDKAFARETEVHDYSAFNIKQCIYSRENRSPLFLLILRQYNSDHKNEIYLKYTSNKYSETVHKND